MNKVELMGRLVKDIEVSKSKNGNDIGKFTLAVPRKADKEKTDFIDCISFGKLPEIIAKYTEKGNRIIVSGELNFDSYTNKDNQTVKTTQIIVNDFYFVDFKTKKD